VGCFVSYRRNIDMLSQMQEIEQVNELRLQLRL
jgi:hypothetical protein